VLSATVPPADLDVSVADTLVYDVDAESDGAQKAMKAAVALGAALSSAPLGVVIVMAVVAPLPVRVTAATGTVEKDEELPVRASDAPAHAE